MANEVTDAATEQWAASHGRTTWPLRGGRPGAAETLEVGVMNTVREIFITVGIWGVAVIFIAIALSIAIYDISQKPAAARTRSQADHRGAGPSQTNTSATTSPGVSRGIGSTAQETSND